MITQPLSDHLEDYRPFRLSHYWNEGFKLFSKNVGSFIVYSFLSFVICLAIVSIPLIGEFVSEILLFPSFAAGFYLIAHRIKNVENFEFEHHFHGFRYFFQLGLMVFLSTIIMKVALLPFYFAHSEWNDWSWSIFQMYESLDFINMVDTYPDFYSWKLIFLLPSFYFFIVYGWAGQFIIFFGMSAWEAMEASRKIITNRWMTFLLFFVTTFLVGFGGLIGLIIGFFVTWPLVMCVDYAAFEEIMQLGSQEQRQEFSETV